MQDRMQISLCKNCFIKVRKFTNGTFFLHLSSKADKFEYKTLKNVQMICNNFHHFVPVKSIACRNLEQTLSENFVKYFIEFHQVILDVHIHLFTKWYNSKFWLLGNFNIIGSGRFQILGILYVCNYSIVIFLFETSTFGWEKWTYFFFFI